MSGVLLAHGPLSVLKSVGRLSAVFKDGMTSSKFVLAAKKLEEAGFGYVIKNQQVFVKNPPNVVASLLMMQEYADLCTLDEYQQSYSRPISSAVSQKAKDTVASMGLAVPQLVVSDVKQVL